MNRRQLLQSMAAFTSVLVFGTGTEKAVAAETEEIPFKIRTPFGYTNATGYAQLEEKYWGLTDGSIIKITGLARVKDSTDFMIAYYPISTETRRLKGEDAIYIRGSISAQSLLESSDPHLTVQREVENAFKGVIDFAKQNGIDIESLIP